jgi:hypothetical protein
VTIGECLLLSNENFRVRKKLNCPTADTGEFTLSTLCGLTRCHNCFLQADIQTAVYDTLLMLCLEKNGRLTEEAS